MQNAADMPQRTVESTNDGLIITYRFTTADIHDDELFPGTVRWEIPGFSLNSTPAEPGVPSYTESFITPKGSTPEIELISASYTDLPYKISPARFPVPDNDTVCHTAENVAQITPYSGFFPSQVCQRLATADYRSMPVARVKINPVLYDYEAGMVRAYTELVYKITYGGADREESLQYEPCSLLNPNCDISSNGSAMALSGESCTAADAGYLIISVPEFEETLAPFIDWKKQMGYNVTALYDSGWTPESIKNAISEQYQSNNSLMYILIVGDHSKVPGEIKQYTWHHMTECFATDFHYGCLGGDEDLVPDLFRGRWPVNTVAQLETVIEKTTRYEQQPVSDPEFYANATHFGYFEDQQHLKNGSYIPGPDGEEDTRFVKTCEDVRDYVQANTGIAVKRIYAAYPPPTFPIPQRWSSVHSFGDSIPKDLRPENYSWNWDGGADDLTGSINKGPLYVLYRGHGNPEGWHLLHPDTVRFGSRNIKTLNNGNKLPLIFSITCYSGDHRNEDCFARNMLTHKNGGAIGLFAQTCSGYKGTNDKLASLFFNAVWPTETGLSFDRYPVGNYLSDPTVSSSLPAYQLGAIMDFSINGLDFTSTEEESVELYTRRITHCFADPALYFNTERPADFAGVDVVRTDSEVTVSLNGESAYISFYDPVNDYSCRFYGTTATYYTGKSECIDVAVYAHNKIPYADNGTEYDPEQPELGGPRSRLIGYRDLRAGSRVEIDYMISPLETDKRISIIIVDMFSGRVISEAQVDKSITDRKQTVTMFSQSGYMVASLMVDGYPQSNLNMIINK